jgi:hypothetical protein
VEGASWKDPDDYCNFALAQACAVCSPNSHARRVSSRPRAIRQGNCGRIQPDLLNDAIFGAIYYRFLLGLTPRFGEELVARTEVRGRRPLL